MVQYHITPEQKGNIVRSIHSLKPGDKFFNCAFHKISVEDEKHTVEWIGFPGSSCVYCKYRKELYEKIPEECYSCGCAGERNSPYIIFVPSYEEGYVPSNVLKR